MPQSAGSLKNFILENFHELVRRKFVNGLEAIVSKHHITSQMEGECARRTAQGGC